MLDENFGRIDADGLDAFRPQHSGKPSFTAADIEGGFEAPRANTFHHRPVEDAFAAEIAIFAHDGNPCLGGFVPSVVHRILLSGAGYQIRRG